MHTYDFREKEISHCYSSTSLLSRSLDWMNFKFMKLYCQKQYIKYACMHTLAITLRGILCLACSILSEGKYFHRKMNPLCHSFQTLLFEERKSCVLRSTWECFHVVLSEMTASYFVELLQKGLGKTPFL